MAENIVKPKDLAPILEADLADDDLLTVYDKSAKISKKLSISEADERWAGGGSGEVDTGNLTSPTTGVTITGGTDAVVGNGTSISIQTATSSQPGLLSAADHTTFSAKQPAGNYVTGLTGDVTASGPGSVAATIPNGTVTNAKMATMATARIKGRSTSGNGAVEDLTGAEATALLDSFAGTTKGLVPTGSSNSSSKILSGAGTWIDLPSSGSGDVEGPASSAADALTVFADTTGKEIKQISAKFKAGIHVLDATTPTLQVINHDNSNPGWEIGKGYWTLSSGCKTAQFLRGASNPETDYIEVAADDTDISGFKRLKWFFLGAMNWDYKQSLLNDLGFRSSIATVSGVHRFDTFLRGATSTRTGETDFNYNLDGSSNTLIASFKPNGEIAMRQVGKGIALTKGTGALAGNATLVAGTVTVTNANVGADSIIMLTRKTAGGTLGNLTYTISNGTSFTINSDSSSDTSVVSYHIIQTVDAL